MAKMRFQNEPHPKDVVKIETVYVDRPVEVEKIVYVEVPSQVEVREVEVEKIVMKDHTQDLIALDKRHGQQHVRVAQILKDQDNVIKQIIEQGSADHKILLSLSKKAERDYKELEKTVIKLKIALGISILMSVAALLWH